MIHLHPRHGVQPVMLSVMSIHVAAPEETGRFMATYLLSATRYGWTIVNLFTSRPRMAVMLNSFTLVWTGCHCKACCRPINASRGLHNPEYTQASPDQCQLTIIQGKLHVSLDSVTCYLHNCLCLTQPLSWHAFNAGQAVTIATGSCSARKVGNHPAISCSL